MQSDARPFNTALIVLDTDFAPLWASQQGIGRQFQVVRDVLADLHDGEVRLAQGQQQLVVDVQGADAMPGAQEIERDPPGARADLEDRTRPATRVGELAPQGEIDSIAPALDVMPDDAGSARAFLGSAGAAP